MTRRAIGFLLALLSISSLVFGMVVLLWMFRFSTIWVIAFGISGVGLLAWWATAPTDFLAFLRGKPLRHQMSSTLATLLLLGIVATLYLMTLRLNVALDATLGNSFSLSPATFSVLQRIPAERRLQITGFYTARNLNQRDVDDQIFRLYEIETQGKVTVQYLDPEREPSLAQRYGVRNDGDVFVSFVDEDGAVLPDSIEYVTRSAKQERDITNAINRLFVSSVLTIYFDTSHTELSLYDDSEQGISVWGEVLTQNGMRVTTLDLQGLVANGESIPIDASTVVIARPSQPIEDAVATELVRYMARGGSLMILADALFAENDAFVEGTLFHTLLKNKYGLSIEPAISIDLGANLQTPLNPIGYATFNEPPFGNRLPDADSFFRIARAVDVLELKAPTVANGSVIMTSPQSYLEFDTERVSTLGTFNIDNTTDRQGPTTLVAWAWDEGGDDSKVVLIGDGDFAMNEVVTAGASGNLAVLAEGINWLSGFDNQVEYGFAANPSDIPALFLSAQQLDFIGILTVAVIPLLVLLVGLIVWYRRNFV
ncbi:MAG: Gldg family protein [Phototrophicaceae bacterium]